MPLGTMQNYARAVVDNAVLLQYSDKKLSWGKAINKSIRSSIPILAYVNQLSIKEWNKFRDLILIEWNKFLRERKKYASNPRTIGKKNIALVKQLVRQAKTEGLEGSSEIENYVIDRLPSEIWKTWEMADQEIRRIIWDYVSELAYKRNPKRAKPLYQVETFEEELATMQDLVNSGQAWHLEGAVGRRAMELIRAGYIMLGTKGHRDAYGNYVPSRFEVKAGTKGSKEFVKEMETKREYSSNPKKKRIPTPMWKPKCQECGRKDKVVKVIYGKRESPAWRGYECERCNVVVKTLYEKTQANNPKRKPDIVSMIMAYETGELDDRGILKLFSHLIKTGQVWSMQGSLYGRPAKHLIKQGYISPEGKILRKI